MNRLKRRSLPAPCPVKWHFYRLAISVSDEIFLKYYNSRKKPQVGSGGGGIWQRLQPLPHPVLLEVRVNYYHGLEYLHSSLHFSKIVWSYKYNFEKVNKWRKTHQQTQDINVVFVRLLVLNKSRTSPSLVVMSAPVSIFSLSSGSSLRLIRAIFVYSFSASSIFPFTNNQRRDSGEML